MSELKVGDVIEAIGHAAPWSKAAGWDPVGLQLGDATAPVQRVAVCHEVTEAVVGAVASGHINLLVTYHPLLFEPTRRLVASRSPVGRAFRLVSAGVALAVAHTNFDVAPGGAADALAVALGIEETAGFGPETGPEAIKVVTFLPAAAADRVTDAMARAGAGRIGHYSSCSFRSEGTGIFQAESWADPATGRAGSLNREPEVRLEMIAPKSAEATVVAALVEHHPYEEPAYDVYDRRGNDGMVGRIGRPPGGTTLRSFSQMVAEVLGGAVRLSWAGDNFNLVAVVPGSGAEFVDSAAASGARVLVTGDVRHHEARRAIDLGLSVIDPGHARTERPGVAALLNLVSAAAPDVVDLTGIDPSPWEGVQ
jgi:dinuclear metal center YbgI/SA1388 family protein